MSHTTIHEHLHVHNHLTVVHGLPSAAWASDNYITDEQATQIGNQLSKLDLLIELILFNQFSDLHTDEYARSLIIPAPCQWPFALFPEIQAVREMYVQRTDACEFTYF